MARTLILLVAVAVLLCGCAGPGEETAAASECSGDCASEQVAELTERIQELERTIELIIGGRRARLDFTGEQSGRVETIYLWDQVAGNETLRPIEVLVGDNLDPVTAVAKAWVAGAPEAGLFSGLGSYPEVLGVKVEEGVAVIDFDRKLADFPGGSAWVGALSISLVYTVTELDGVDTVLVTMNGEPAILHGMNWDTPVGRDDFAGHTFTLAGLIRYEGHGVK